MKKLFPAVFLLLFFSCNNRNTPDVSNIKINTVTTRFEQAFFDTGLVKIKGYLQHLNDTTPGFEKFYLLNILGVDPRLPIDTSASEIQSFIKAYKDVYDTAGQKFKDFTVYENEIKKGLQFVKYYFPAYKTPSKIITFIGPADGVGDGLSADGILVGLHHHLGKDFPIYKTEMVMNFYPAYISRRFEPDYIAINAMINIVNDLFPEKETDKPLINQMVEKGKRLYVLQQLLPETPEYKLIGYTNQQMKDCYKNESFVWNLFVKNGYLQSIDKDIIKNYVSESPNTAELGEDSPGNIGSFCGWQIVKKYMQKNKDLTLQQLMDKDDELIFQETKYKP